MFIMRKLKIFIFLCLTLVGSSCSWLEVPFEDRISEDELFENGDGYRRVLVGVYTSISTDALYGKELTWGFMDVLGQMYNLDNSSSLVYKNAINYSWKDLQVAPVMEQIWCNVYNAIANCNNLIQQVQKADSSLFAFKEVEKNMILAEALALRGMLHFDLLRIFAPAPVTQPTGTWLPYNKIHPETIPLPITVDAFLKNVFADLLEAQKLLKDIDLPNKSAFQKTFRFGIVAGINNDRFMDHRGYRMNYYSVTALLARAYFYAGGEYEELAYNEASRLIEQCNTTSFSFSSEDDIRLGDIKFYGDVLGGLYNEELTDFDKSVNGTTQYLALNNIEAIYGEELEDDLRYKNQVEKYEDEGVYYYRLVKYREQTGNVLTNAEISSCLIPLIRLSEMYYIAGEYLFDKDPEKAQSMLAHIKTGRGLLNVNLSNLLVKEDYMNALENDMRREFVGEGQVFFYYKRLNKTIPGFVGNMTNDHFVAPIPDSEKI